MVDFRKSDKIPSLWSIFDEMGYAWNPSLHHSDEYLYISLSFFSVSPSPHIFFIFSFRYSISVGQVFDQT